MPLRRVYPILLLGLANFLAVAGLYGQEGKASVKPGSDVLIFNDGEKLIGHLQSATSTSVTFKSDMAGEITVDWSKVKELHTTQKFAVIPKGVELRNGVDTSQVPQGTVSMAAQKLNVHPEGQAPEAIPVGDTAHVIDEPAFQRAVSENPGFFKKWKGAITAGAALVQATQTSRSFSGSVNLIRAIPSETWLDPRNRTTFDFTAAYGVLDQPGTAEIKTEIYHAGAERDEYFSPRFYAFGQLAYDHNYSQGLDLQQLYGGGVGWTALKDAEQELDLKASLSYIEQSFTDAGKEQSLFGSTFAEDYNRKFIHGILLTEQLAVTPAWTNTNAYSALGNMMLTMPVYKRLNVTFGTVDTFLNDPPPGFKKNSFQLTTGLAYALQ